MHPAPRRQRFRPSGTAVQLAFALPTLAALIAFFLIAYGANRGLPWQQRYHVYVQLPSAVHLIPTDDVEIAGVRVGEVASVEAVPARGSQPVHVRVGLELDPRVGPLPLDTRVRVNAASVLGADYLDLIPGHSRRVLGAGQTLPLSDAGGTVDLTDLFDIFDRGAQRGLRETIATLGEGLAGRGVALNQALGAFAGALPPLQRVAAAIAPKVGSFVAGAAAFSGALDPVRAALAELLSAGQRTFTPLAAARATVGRAIALLPGSETALTGALRALDPALVRLAGLATQLLPAGRLLPGALGQIDVTAAAAVPALRLVPPFAARLGGALGVLDRVARATSTDGAVRKLTDLIAATGQLLAVLEPAQVYCDVISLWGWNFGSMLAAAGAGPGPSLGDLAFTTIGASGEVLQQAQPSYNVDINYLPRENQGVCESGNEPADAVHQYLNNVPSVHSTAHPQTQPPAGVRERAAAAGLLSVPEGVR